MDRLRYEEQCSAVNQAPAVVLLRKAVEMMDQGSIAIGTICHSLWLFCADPSLIKGREVTCAHNIVCDVENAGAKIISESGTNVELHQQGLLLQESIQAALMFSWKPLRLLLKQFNYQQKV